MMCAAQIINKPFHGFGFDEKDTDEFTLLYEQEERDAELKQLRKSLSFKATPMPSFYHGAAPKARAGKKVPPL